MAAATIFVDTNILVYAHDKSAGPKNKRAQAILGTIWQDRSGMLSTQVLQEFYVTVTKKLPRPLEPAQTRDVLKLLLAWKIVRPAPESVIEASLLSERYQLSFWDALILQAAIEGGAQLLYSEDIQEGMDIAGLRIKNPLK